MKLWTLALCGLSTLVIAGCKDNGDGVSDSDVPEVVDADGDGVPVEEDCDDQDAGAFPGATEICDGVDNNCDGQVDEGVQETFYVDADHDGYGNPEYTAEACEGQEGYADNGDDCDDGEAANYPGNIEICDGVDNDCDAAVDDDDDSLDMGTATRWYLDQDSDGYGDLSDFELQCAPMEGRVDNAEDCDPEDAAQHPGADELCNGEDDDCNGTVDDDYAVDAPTWYADADVDGYGDPDSPRNACELPEGYVDDDQDCDPADAAQYPGADEYCNGEDDDCNETVDDDYAVDATTWYADADQDGYGDPDTSATSCAQPSGYEDDSDDCDDADAEVNPDATEVCDGIDNDCDSATSEDGMASWVDSSGTLTDVSSSVAGSSGSPVAYTISSEGELFFCDGTFYVNLAVDADATLTGASGDPSAVELNGDSNGSVILMETDGVAVTVQDLSLADGSGSGAVDSAYFAATGGGISCVGSNSTLTVDNVDIHDSEADAGGAIAAEGCTVDITDSAFFDNLAEYGGALYFVDGSFDVTDSEVYDNLADYGGGLYNTYTSSGAETTLDGSWFTGNEATVSGGGALSELSKLTCSGSSSSDAGFAENIADTYGGGLYILDPSDEFTADVCDFGTASVGDDNADQDIWCAESGFEYMPENDRSFTCDGESCGSSTSYSIGSSGSSPTDDDAAKWIIFEADNPGTLDSFDWYLDTNGSCTVEFHVLSSSNRYTWTNEWNADVSSTSTSAQYLNSGDIGIAVEEGTWYALVAAWNCSNAVEYWYTSTSSTYSTGLGDIVNGGSDSSYSSGDYDNGTYESFSSSGYTKYLARVYSTSL